MNRCFFFLITTITVTITVTVTAVFADNKDINNINISSDSAKCVRQNAADICSYSGNARFAQGKDNLTAQQIIIYKLSDNKIDKIVAAGKHSHYSTSNAYNKISADADLIRIYPKEHKMNLKGNGVIISGQDKYRGPDINYQFE